MSSTPIPRRKNGRSFVTTDPLRPINVPSAIAPYQAIITHITPKRAIKVLDS